jgi:glyoxylase-like metal-dependent hydrolase (beta-lactamase superfamily II)
MKSSHTVYTLAVGALETNCYLLAEASSRAALCIDPGDDAEAILDLAARHHLSVAGIALTHGHGDHIGAVSALRAAWDVPVYIHDADAVMLTSAERNLSVHLGVHISTAAPDTTLDDGMTIDFGDTRVRVLHTPGHTRGGVCYLVREATPVPLLFSGDTLFAREVGRCDLPGGSFPTLQQSIRAKLYTLPGNTRVFPGHGPPTTIAEEQRENPHVRLNA